MTIRVGRTDTFEPADERLDGSDLRGLRRVWSLAGGDDAVRDVHGAKGARGLQDEFLTMDEHEGAVALGGWRWP